MSPSFRGPGGCGIQTLRRLGNACRTFCHAVRGGGSGVAPPSGLHAQLKDRPVPGRAWARTSSRCHGGRRGGKWEIRRLVSANSRQLPEEFRPCATYRYLAVAGEALCQCQRAPMGGRLGILAGSEACFHEKSPKTMTGFASIPVLDWNGPEFLWFCAAAFVIALGWSLLRRSRANDRFSNPSAEPAPLADPYEIAFLAGGTPRCSQVLRTSLAGILTFSVLSCAL